MRGYITTSGRLTVSGQGHTTHPLLRQEQLVSVQQMQEASLLLAYGFGFGAAVFALAIFRRQLNGTKPTVFHFLLVSLLLEAIKLVARGASNLLSPSDWMQVEQFVACRAIYSFFHALSLPALFVSILLSLQSLSAHDPPNTRDKGQVQQYVVDAPLLVVRLLLGLIRSSIFTASIYAIDVELVPQTGVSPELGSLDLLAITLVIFDVLLAIDISLRTWWLRRKTGQGNRPGPVWGIFSKYSGTCT